MLLRKADAKARNGEGVSIFNMLTAEMGASISAALVELDGEHPTSISKNTDRYYLFISGKAIVSVGEETFDVNDNDVVYIERGKPHSVSGKAKYFVVNNPPYVRAA